jgi:hypothetical protein
MLSEIETSFSAAAFVNNDAIDDCAATASPAHEFRSCGERPPYEGDSFFYIAMRLSGPRVRTLRRGRSHR